MKTLQDRTIPNRFISRQTVDRPIPSCRAASAGETLAATSLSAALISSAWSDCRSHNLPAREHVRGDAERTTLFGTSTDPDELARRLIPKSLTST